MVYLSIHTFCMSCLAGREEHKEDRYFTQAAEIFAYVKYKRS